MEPKDITLREYFSAMAMQGIMANSIRYDRPTETSRITGFTFAENARFAVDQADALIKALAKKEAD